MNTRCAVCGRTKKKNSSLYCRGCAARINGSARGALRSKKSWWREHELTQYAISAPGHGWDK